MRHGCEAVCERAFVQVQRVLGGGDTRGVHAWCGIVCCCGWRCAAVHAAARSLAGPHASTPRTRPTPTSNTPPGAPTQFMAALDSSDTLWVNGWMDWMRGVWPGCGGRACGRLCACERAGGCGRYSCASVLWSEGAVVQQGCVWRGEIHVPHAARPASRLGATHVRPSPHPPLTCSSRFHGPPPRHPIHTPHPSLPLPNLLCSS